jgi:hypothetical protein
VQSGGGGQAEGEEKLRRERSEEEGEAEREGETEREVEAEREGEAERGKKWKGRRCVRLARCCRILSWSSWSHGFLGARLPLLGARPPLRVLDTRPPLQVLGTYPPLLGALRRQIALRRSTPAIPPAIELEASGPSISAGGRRSSSVLTTPPASPGKARKVS